MEGLGGALEGEEGESPWNEAKADGVRDVASAGGGRPVILAKRVRSQRRRVKMPRIEPRVVRRFANCSATEIIAGEKVCSARTPPSYRKCRECSSPKKLECVAM